MSSRLLTSLIVLILFAAVTQAQFSSNLQGVVLDETGAVIPEATVNLLDLATGLDQTVQTGNTGVYRFSSLRPGTYEVTAEATGFQPQTQVTRLQTASTSGLNITLAVAGTEQRVVVTAEAPALDTSESRIQATIQNEELQDLPFKGRNFLALAAVAPGVTGFMAGSISQTTAGESEAPDNFSPAKIVDVSANGRSYVGNMFTIDGLDTSGNIVPGSADISPNPDAIEEISVQTNTFKVEEGKTSSIVVAITTKSGTNEFHGTGSYFFSNQDLWARTIFTNEYEPFKRHEMSGVLGGPIVKNKTFFIVTTQALRSQSSSSTSAQTFESTEFSQWAQQNFPNSLGAGLLRDYPLTNVSPVGTAATAQDIFGIGASGCETPATANIPCSLPMITEGRFKPSPFRNGLQYSLRGDQYFNNAKDRIYGQFYSATLEQENVPFRSGFDTKNDNVSWAVTTNWTHTFSPTLLNEFKFGGTYVDGTNLTSGPFRIPNVGISGQSVGLSAGWGPGTFIQHNYNWKDVVTWVRGSHTLKIGAQVYRPDGIGLFAGVQRRPSFFFNNLLDLVRDAPFSQGGTAYDPLTGQPGIGDFAYEMTTAGIFVQDEWKVRPNLMLTLGIRWDDFGNPHEKEGYNPYSNIHLGPGSTLDEQFANASVVKQFHNFGHRLNNNWSPRVGIAWDPGGDGKWSVRGGFGVYHDWVTMGQSGDQVRSNPPGFVFPSFRVDTPIKPIFSVGTQDEFPYGFRFPTIPAGQLDEKGGLVGVQAYVGGIDNDGIRAARAVNYTFGVERAISGSTVAGASYSGSRSWGGYVGSDFNRFAGDLFDGKLDRLNSSFGAMQWLFNGNDSSYNAMILTLRRRLSSGLQFQGSYTLSHVTDFGQAGSRSTRDNAFAFPSQHNLSRYKADSDWDARHRVSLSSVFFIPEPATSSAGLKRVLGGWELSTITILQSGLPFPVVHRRGFLPELDANGNVVGFQPGSGDFNADGQNYDYPDMPSKDFTGSHSRQQFLQGIFTAADFPLPAPGTHGSLPRNIYRGPGTVNVDLSLLKNNKVGFLGERGNLQLRFDFYNVLNRVNLRGVDNNMASGTFGRSVRSLDPRIVVLGARIVF